MNMILIFCFLMMICSATNNPPSHWLPIQPITQDLATPPHPEVTLQQGRSGRIGPIGPVGPIGPKGEPGSPGSCDCKSSEIEQLRSQMQGMKGRKKFYE